MKMNMPILIKRLLAALGLLTVVMAAYYFVARPL